MFLLNSLRSVILPGILDSAGSLLALLPGNMDYKSCVYERICELYRTDEFCDVVFLLRNGRRFVEVKGHRILFAIASPVFKAMLFGNLAEKDEVKIEDIEPDAFKAIKRFLYTDEIKFESVFHAIDVYMTADKYDLPQLAKVAEEYISSNVNAGNLNEILAFCQMYDNQSINNAAIYYIKNNTNEVINSESFLSLSMSTLEEIVKMDRLQCTEIDLFNAINKWAVYTSMQQGLRVEAFVKSLSPVINRIRFLCMTPSEFVEGPSKSKLLPHDDIIKLIQYITSPGSTDIPTRFCVSTSLRNGNVLQQRTKYLTIKWTKEDVFGMWQNFYYDSPRFYVADMPWKLSLKLYTGDDGEKWISLYLFSLASGRDYEKNWSCVINIKLRFKSQNERVEDLCFNNAPRIPFGKGNTNVCIMKLRWSLITNENSFLVKDNKMKIEADMKEIRRK